MAQQVMVPATKLCTPRLNPQDPHGEKKKKAVTYSLTYTNIVECTHIHTHACIHTHTNPNVPLTNIKKKKLSENPY